MRRSILLLAMALAACNHDGVSGSGVDSAVAPLDLAPSTDAADRFPTCRVVSAQVTLSAPELQMAIWVEDTSGHVVDTLYVTSATAKFGIANRPGSATLKTDFRWPYGRREMVLPIWAHRRNHHYPRLVMGGRCNGAPVNSPASLCGNGGGACMGECDDTTIAYHSPIESFDPYFCWFNGGICPNLMPSGCAIALISCAQRGFSSKGAFAGGWNGGVNPTTFSLYPPRVDLTVCQQEDSPDACGMAALNDLVVVSQATPPANTPVDISWVAPASLANGDYRLWIEISQESDFNASNHWPQQHDSVTTWDFEGHDFLGQPSMAWWAPLTIGGSGFHTISFVWAGYGSWDGSDGELRPPDSTITVGSPGTGAGRLAALTLDSGRCQ